MTIGELNNFGKRFDRFKRLLFGSDLKLMEEHGINKNKIDWYNDLLKQSKESKEKLSKSIENQEKNLESSEALVNRLSEKYKKENGVFKRLFGNPEGKDELINAKLTVARNKETLKNLQEKKDQLEKDIIVGNKSIEPLQKRNEDIQKELGDLSVDIKKEKRKVAATQLGVTALGTTALGAAGGVYLANKKGQGNYYSYEDGDYDYYEGY